MLSLLRRRPQLKIQKARYRAHKIPTTDTDTVYKQKFLHVPLLVSFLRTAAHWSIPLCFRRKYFVRITLYLPRCVLCSVHPVIFQTVIKMVQQVLAVTAWTKMQECHQSSTAARQTSAACPGWPAARELLVPIWGLRSAGLMTTENRQCDSRRNISNNNCLGITQTLAEA